MCAHTPTQYIYIYVCLNTHIHRYTPTEKCIYICMYITYVAVGDDVAPVQAMIRPDISSIRAVCNSLPSGLQFGELGYYNRVQGVRLFVKPTTP